MELKLPLQGNTNALLKSNWMKLKRFKKKKKKTLEDLLFTYGQVQTGLDLPVLSDPGVHMASVPHGLGLHKEPK